LPGILLETLPRASYPSPQSSDNAVVVPPGTLSARIRQSARAISEGASARPRSNRSAACGTALPVTIEPPQRSATRIVGASGFTRRPASTITAGVPVKRRPARVMRTGPGAPPGFEGTPSMQSGRPCTSASASAAAVRRRSSAVTPAPEMPSMSAVSVWATVRTKSGRVPRRFVRRRRLRSGAFTNKIGRSSKRR
jgi:hypothetical protein